MKVKEDLRDLRRELRKERDELKLQAHLFKSEVKDEWEDVEKKWQKFESLLSTKSKAAAEAAREFADATGELGTDIRAAYQRFRKSL